MVALAAVVAAPAVANATPEAPAPAVTARPTVAVAAPPVAAAAAAPARLPRCDRALPIPGRPPGFRHFGHRVDARLAEAQHRGYDVFVRAGEPQWVTAKFAYGVSDRDLSDEDVDVYVLRDCRAWEPLGSARTSRDGAATRAYDGATVTDGGRVAFRIPDARRLGVGLHRVRFVVRGDRSAADAYVNVVGAGARFVVTDVDGTLTEGESANFMRRVGLRRSDVGANPGAAAALTALARQGYQVFYLTGRPSRYTAETHAWLAANGFPRGVLRTQTGAGLGLSGGNTTRYKTAELTAASRVLGRSADWAFGNTAIDVAAYRDAGVPAAGRYFFRFAGDTSGGVRHDDYRVLAARLTTAPAQQPAQQRAGDVATR